LSFLKFDAKENKQLRIIRKREIMVSNMDLYSFLLIFSISL
jgi:hypothetical protein